MMKTLLILMPDVKSGGAERSLVNFLNACDLKKYRVELLLFSRTGTFLLQLPAPIALRQEPMLTLLFSRNRAELVEARRRHPLLGLWAGAVKILGTALGRVGSRGNPWLARQIRWHWVYRRCIPCCRIKADIVVAWLEGECSWYAAERVDAARRVLWFHNDYAALGYDARWDKRLFSKADALVTISDGCAASLKAAFPELQERVEMLPNILPAAWIRARSEEPVPETLAGEGPVLLSIGRLSPQKGFDLAIGAAKILKEEGVPFRWFILGDGRLREELTALAASEGVEELVQFPGATDNPYPWLRRADVFVQPSRYEGKSIVLDEAKLLCKPIVATTYPTVQEQLSPEEGLVVPLTAEGLAAGIRRMLGDPMLRQNYSEHLMEHSQEEINLLKKYEQVLEG